MCVCVCALVNLTNSGLHRRTTSTSSGLESQQVTFVKSAVIYIPLLAMLTCMCMCAYICVTGCSMLMLLLAHQW